MAQVSQGQVFRCDFGAEGGVELAGPCLALVVSRDDYNQGSSSVLVVPTTRGGVDPRYIDYYPPLEQFDTRASCRNIRAIRADRLRRLKGTAKRSQMADVVRRGVWPYLWSSVRHAPYEGWATAPGTVHNGFIPNHRGEIEETWFLVLACNRENCFATVAKVDQVPVGESRVRIPLTAADGPPDMAAYSHGIQAVDLNVAFDGLESPSYVGTVHPRSLIRVTQKVALLTKLPTPRRVQ